MLAIAGGKGGCGKTTTAVGLARALADRGATPVVIDADRDMPSVPAVAGREPDTVVGETHPSAVRSLAPSRDVVLVGCAGASVADLSETLSTFAADDGPVLVDCPAGAGPDAARPLRHADRTLVVSTPGRASLTDATKTVEMARAVGTTVVGSLVVESDGSVDPRPLLDCPTLGHVPRVDGDPLSDRRVQGSHADIIVKSLWQNI